MAEQASASIVIDADKATVMGVIADFDAYPEWSGQIKKVEVLETGPDGRGDKVKFHVDAGVFKDEYTLAYDWNGDDSVSWNLVQGKAQKHQEGSYTLEETDDGVHVTYRLNVDLQVPMLGMLKRKAERMIMDTALKGLKARVEG